MKQFDTTRYLASVVKTELQTTYNYRLKVKHRLNRAFEIIPSNAIINKGRCGIGGTYLEIKAERNSIIVVPTNAIIDNKCFDSDGKLLPNYYVVRGKHKRFNYPELNNFINSEANNKKIFCTPESLRKIFACGIDHDTIHKEWFLLFDEAHTPITDSHRKNIIEAFKYFFNFHNKAVISATPYVFSDTRFNHFDVYNIKFRGYVNRVKIINTNNVESLLHSHLINPTAYPGRVHIFLNSVTEIGNTIRRTQIKDYSIFCKEDRKNKDKLDELRNHLKDSPNPKSFSKFNFYTSKYFEGWDLDDINATIIIISDISSTTLKVGISNKCVQAAGRNRRHSYQIIHITNSRDILEYKTVKEIEDQLIPSLENTVAKYNEHLDETKQSGSTYFFKFKQLAEECADIDKQTSIAKLNKFKIDQFVNADFCHQQFNHKNYIVQAWEDAGFKTDSQDAYIPILPENIQRLKETDRIKAVVEFMDNLKLIGKENAQNLIQSLESLPIDTERIIDAYKEIGGDKMRELEYYPKFINEAVFESKNLKGMELVKEDYFKKFGYTKQLIRDINPTLKSLYINYNIRNPKTGDIIAANAKQLLSIFTDVQHYREHKLNGYHILIK